MTKIIDGSWMYIDVSFFSDNQNTVEADMLGLKSALAKSLFEFKHNAFVKYFGTAEAIPLNVFNNLAIVMSDVVFTDRSVNIQQFSDCLVLCPHYSTQDLIKLSNDFIGFDQLVLGARLRPVNDAVIDKFLMEENLFLDAFYERDGRER